MDNKTNIITNVSEIGHNFQPYKFLNGEQYRLYFYVDYFDNRISMSIYDSSNTPIIEDRQLAVSSDICPDVSELKGIFSIEGDDPTINTIDNTSNLYYTYKVPNV